MAEGEESRFVCKLCCKKFPSGKSLGGHMRSHVVANSAEFGGKIELLSMKRNPLANAYESKFAESGNGQSGYGLRENPKKTWRAVDPRLPLPQDYICKRCGKGFQSKKALCGHMACHSDKEKGNNANHSWSSENQKIVLDSQSANNGSSSVSEIDSEEEEEMARCLMMLSRDCGTKGGVNSVVESSDNNSVVVETKSSSTEMKSGRNLDEETAKIEDSDSGYFLDECAKDESDVSYDWFRRNGGLNELKKPQNELDNDGVVSKSKCGGIESRKRKKHGYENQEPSTRMVKKGGELCSSNYLPKKSKYECFNCGKVFKSYHALGGHRPCHKRSNASSESLDENRPDTKFVESSRKRKTSDKNSAEKKAKNKNEPQACPFCGRMFKNGQALGGHKRSHFLTGHDESNKNTSPVEKSHDLLDLNLPAPEANEDESGSHFFSW